MANEYDIWHGNNPTLQIRPHSSNKIKWLNDFLRTSVLLWGQSRKTFIGQNKKLKQKWKGTKALISASP